LSGDKHATLEVELNRMQRRLDPEQRNHRLIRGVPKSQDIYNSRYKQNRKA